MVQFSPLIFTIIPLGPISGIKYTLSLVSKKIEKEILSLSRPDLDCPFAGRSFTGFRHCSDDFCLASSCDQAPLRVLEVFVASTFFDRHIIAQLGPFSIGTRRSSIQGRFDD